LSVEREVWFSLFCESNRVKSDGRGRTSDSALRERTQASVEEEGAEAVTFSQHHHFKRKTLRDELEDVKEEKEESEKEVKRRDVHSRSRRMRTSGRRALLFFMVAF
jgi:hypothetical protein